MNWDHFKGLSIIADFSELYLLEGPIHRSKLFINPEREKYGYLWNISPDQLDLGNIGVSLQGILITNDLDARMVLALYNRLFFDSNKESLVKGIKSYINTLKNISNPSNAELDKLYWENFNGLLKEIYNRDYAPFKKFLNEPVKNNIWVPLFGETSSMDPTARKGYYQMIKWIIGENTIILDINSKYNKYWQWEETILHSEGPMGNPELPIIESFCIEYPGSIKHVPDGIVKKLDLDTLGGLSDFGISFH